VSTGAITEKITERIGAFEAILDRVTELNVLVVGDLLLDEYRSGEVVRVSPEAPVPIVHVRDSRADLGGAANVARGVVALGAQCRLVGLVGEDQEGETLLGLVDDLGISTADILRTADRPTSHKLRVVARGQQMLRIDRESDAAIGPELDEKLRIRLAEAITGCDLVILEDYDKGMFGDGLAHWVIELSRSRGKLVVADPKRDLARFRGAALVKPNLDEAILFVSGSGVDFDARRNLLEKLHHELGGGEVVVTRGRFGMSGRDVEGRVFDVPTRALEVYDVQGAGDTSIAVLGLCRAAGATLDHACLLANAAAAIVVEKVGTAQVSPSELRARLPEILAIQSVTEGE
jgi:D-beta-D-heptose 7-phosphate kinase/D-beta-D-heptose 1-phosphate adenosyltransferase